MERLNERLHKKIRPKHDFTLTKIYMNKMSIYFKINLTKFDNLTIDKNTNLKTIEYCDKIKGEKISYYFK